MGLAASQARLLTITSRVHDNEFQAEDIMNKKITLATQKDDIYDEYITALDAKKIQVAVEHDGSLNYVDATFATVCGFNKDRVGTFALTDPRTGDMVVDDDVYNTYQAYQGRDKYAFAMAMLGIGENDGYSDHRISSIQIGVNDRGEYDPDSSYSYEFTNNETGQKNHCILMNDAEAAVYESHESDLQDKMSAFTEALKTGDSEKIQNACDGFRKALYNKFANEIFQGLAEFSGDKDLQDPEFYDNDEFNYYVKLFEGIEAAGGCEKISEFSDGSTDNDWFNNVVQSGTLLLNQYSSNKSNKGWNVINTGSSPNQDTKETSDNVAIKKAEAKYEHDLGQINQKEKKYDNTLKKLETERTALTTEMDSIKKVKDENIERTFGIFS